MHEAIPPSPQYAFKATLVKLLSPLKDERAVEARVYSELCPCTTFCVTLTVLKAARISLNNFNQLVITKKSDCIFVCQQVDFCMTWTNLTLHFFPNAALATLPKFPTQRCPQNTELKIQPKCTISLLLLHIQTPRSILPYLYFPACLCQKEERALPSSLLRIKLFASTPTVINVMSLHNPGLLFIIIIIITQVATSYISQDTTNTPSGPQSHRVHSGCSSFQRGCLYV